MSTANLASKKCVPCEGIEKPFDKTKALDYMQNVPGWQLDEQGKAIFRDYNTKNFMTAVKFINDIAGIAEAENHHPDLHLTGYRKLKIVLSTHAIGGLSENDFIVASKINDVPVELKQDKK